MSRDLNKVLLMGRLGADPVPKQSASGVTWVLMSIATSIRSGGERAGPNENETEPKEITEWHKVIAFGRLAEVCAQYLKKGRSIFVEGSIRSSKFTDEDGKPRSVKEIHAERVLFLDGKKSTETSDVDAA